MKKYSKKEILDKGGELFRQRGYHNTGINEILKTCGIPKGSFYNFFESKEDFGVQVLDDYGETQYNFIKETLKNNDLTPLAKLKYLYQDFITTLGNENCQYGCLVGNITQELAGINNSFSSATSKQFHRITSLINSVILEGQEQGEIINEFNTEELSEYIHGSFFGAITRAKAERNTNPLTLWLKITFNFLKKK